jgi:hypothetical protein
MRKISYPSSIANYSKNNHNPAYPTHEKSKQLTIGESPQQLELFVTQNTGLSLKIKPQIASIPGASLKERHRYRVTSGGEVLGDFLTLDEAIALANQSTHL